MKTVGNITWNSWADHPSGTYDTWAATGTYVGHYVLDRQLCMGIEVIGFRKQVRPNALRKIMSF